MVQRGRMGRGIVENGQWTKAWRLALARRLVVPAQELATERLHAEFTIALNYSTQACVIHHLEKAYLFRDFRGAWLTESGRVVYDKSEVLEQRPRDDELMVAIADLKAGCLTPQPVWNQHPQTTREVEDSKANRGQQVLRLTPLSNPAARPMMHPGTRFIAFVSLVHS